MSGTDHDFICVDCDVEFAWDESPSDERCAVCDDRRDCLLGPDEEAA